MTKEQIGIGIIGAGEISDFHAKGYLDSKSTRLVAFADIREELAERKARKFGAEASYGSVDKLLKDDRIDAVSICVPNALHSKYAVDACESGKHVFVEKPMARNTRECQEMIDAARKASVKLMVNHVLKFFPTFVECKKIIENYGIGTLIRMRCTQTGGHPYSGWRADPEQAGGGIIIEGLVHPIYLSEWFLGNINVVLASTGRTGPTVKAEDVAILTLQSKDGKYSVVDANLNGPKPLWDDRLEFIGDHGLILANGAEQQIISAPPILYYRDNGLWTAYRQAVLYYDERPRFPNEIEWSWPRAFVYSTREFLKSIEEDRDPTVTGSDGKRIIGVIKACYESADKGKRIEINSS